MGRIPLSPTESPFRFLEQVQAVDDTREDYLRYRLKVPGTKNNGGSGRGPYRRSVRRCDASPTTIRVLQRIPSILYLLEAFEDAGWGCRIAPEGENLGGTVEIDTFVEAHEMRLRDGGNAITLKFIRGNIERFDARFRAYAIDDKRTFVVFYLMIDPDLWFARNATLSEYNWVNCGRTVGRSEPAF